MKNELKRKQHYVPKCYLNSFTDSNGKLCAYNKLYNSFSYKTPSQICYRINLYETPIATPKPYFILPNYLENYNGIIENDYSEWTRKVGKYLTIDNYASVYLSKQDYELLDVFFVNLFVRHPNTIGDIGALPPRDSSIKENFLKVFDEGISDSLSLAYSKIEFMNHSFQRSFAAFFEKELCNYQRTVLISDKANFVTSDVPFILNVEPNIDKNSVSIKQILIPLTPKCLFSYSHFFKKDKMRVSDNTVRKINRLFLEKRKAESKYVFSCEKEDIETIR